MCAVRYTPDENPLEVLVVDDLEDNRILLRLDLEDEIAGVEVTEAGDGREALGLLSKRDFSVVVCDLMMPGLDGFETYELYKRRQPYRTTPFIFLSANKQKDVAEEGIRIGGFDYLTKPYELPELIGKVLNLARMKNLTDSLRITQKELIRSNESLKQYIQEKDDFIRMLSHDMKTPIMSVSGMSEELFSARGPQDLLVLAEAIKHSTADLIKISDQFSALARDDMGAFVPHYAIIDVAKTVRSVLAAYIILAQQKGLDVEVDLPKGELHYCLDELKLHQCISNLFYNAVKFTPSGGKILLKAYEQNDTLFLSVKDTGIGIPEALHDQLFKKYSAAKRDGTNQEKGSGLGLAIVKRFVELMDGHIEFNSEEDKGTEFIISFDSTLRSVS